MDRGGELAGRRREILADRLLYLLLVHSEMHLPEPFDYGGQVGLIGYGADASWVLRAGGAGSADQRHHKQPRPPQPDDAARQEFADFTQGHLDTSNHVTHSSSNITRRNISAW